MEQLPTSRTEILNKVKVLWSKKKSTLILIFACVVLFLLIILMLFLIYFISSKPNKQNNVISTLFNLSGTGVPAGQPKKAPTLTPTPTPTPRPFLPGPHIFSVSSPENIILVKQIYISALDTKIGQPVTMKLDIQDGKSPIKSVSVKIINDKKSQTPVFSLKSGTSSDGTWEGQWVTNDTHWYNYQAEITIKDAGGNTFAFTPTFR